jgi:hypothetical protein
MPVAIRSASRRPGVSDSNQERRSNSSTAAAPGPTSGVARFVRSREPEPEQHRVAGEGAPAVGLEVRLHRLDAVRDDVPEEEDEDAGRDRRERGAHGG